MSTTEKKEISLEVEGMTCAGCAGSVKNYLEKSGMQDVQVDLPGGEAYFSTDLEVDIEEITAGLGKIGYKSKLAGEEAEANPKKTWHRLYTLCLVSLLFTLPLLGAMFLPFPLLKNPWFQLAMTLPVYGIGIGYFGKSAWGALKNGTSNMDVLIFLGSTAAFFYSLYGAINGLPDFIFFETAATIISLVLLGNVLEKRALDQTNSSMEKLMALKPKTAHLVTLNDQGVEELQEVKSAKLSPGQMVLVRAGEKVPCDGKVMSGEAYADASLLTGESDPIALKGGDPIRAGYLIDGGALYVQVSKVGKSDTVGQIIEMVKKARSQKPQIQKLSDRVSAIFVPAVVGIAVLWFLVAHFALGLGVQEAFLRSVAILVISCPCAMGLAVPAAVTVGLGLGSKKGILFKSADVTEQISKAKHLLLDKTGTLTEGKPSVKEADLPKEHQDLLYSLMRKSSHPLSKTVAEWLKGEATTVALKEVKEHKGKGLRAVYQGQNVQVGSANWLGESIDLRGQRADMMLAVDGKLQAWLNFEDKAKANVKETLAELKALGLEPHILSGDRKEKVQALADQLGVEHWQGELLPDQKLATIHKHKKLGITLMVGDGINDAPALSAADVGISLGSGTDLAQEQAQVILLKDDFGLLAKAHKLGSRIHSTIKQNLFWAFAYNVVAIPIAALGYLDPMWAAGFMAFSDLVVIGNSLRLKTARL